MSNAVKADEAALAAMHGLFAQVLLQKLKTGDLEKGDLNVIRQFLKDNAIDCYGPSNEVMNGIAANLPSFEAEEGSNIIPLEAAYA